MSDKFLVSKVIASDYIDLVSFLEKFYQEKMKNWATRLEYWWEGTLHLVKIVLEVQN